MRLKLIDLFIKGAILFAPLCSALPAGGAVLEQIAAVVNDDIIFLTDVERYLVLFAPPEIRLPINSPLPAADSDPVKSALQEVINERLLVVEAKRFGVDPPSEAETGQAVEKLRERFSSDEEFQDTLRRLGSSPEGLREEIRSRLLVDRFIDQRIRYFIFVTPEDVERYYRERQDEFGQKSLESVRERIQMEITEQRLRIRRQDYLTRLRARAVIRVNL